MKLKLLAAVAALVLCGVVSPAYSTTVGFIYSGGSYTTFSVPSAQNTEAFGINNVGQIVGDYWNDCCLHQAFLYSGGSYNTLSPPGSQQAIAFGINNVGQIVGVSGGASGGTGQGFLYSGGSYNTSPIINSSYYGINDAGQIVGFPFALNVPGASPNFGINNLGQVVGTMPGLLPGSTQGFLYSGVTYNTLNVPGAIWTAAYGINNLGDIVGASNLGAFLYSGGSFTTIIGLINGNSSEAFGINDAGQIVGRLDAGAGAGATPLPAALPLFASGLGALGLLGWRRKRKAATSNLNKWSL